MEDFSDNPEVNCAAHYVMLKKLMGRMEALERKVQRMEGLERIARRIDGLERSVTRFDALERTVKSMQSEIKRESRSFLDEKIPSFSNSNDPNQSPFLSITRINNARNQIKDPFREIKEFRVKRKMKEEEPTVTIEKTNYSPFNSTFPQHSRPEKLVSTYDIGSTLQARIDELNNPKRSSKKSKKTYKTSLSGREIMYRCNQCAKMFKTKDAETYHAKKVCPGAVLEQIRAVPKIKEENSKVRKNKHLSLEDTTALLDDSPNNTETDEYPKSGSPLMYRCNQCDKRFKTKDAEKYHAKKVCPNAVLERVEEQGFSNIKHEVKQFKMTNRVIKKTNETKILPTFNETFEEDLNSSVQLPLLPSIKLEPEIPDYLPDQNEESIDNIHLDTMPVTQQLSPKKSNKPHLYRCNKCNKKFKTKDAETYHAKKVCLDSVLVRIDEGGSDDSTTIPTSEITIDREISEDEGDKNEAKLLEALEVTSAKLKYDWSKIDDIHGETPEQ